MDEVEEAHLFIATMRSEAIMRSSILINDVARHGDRRLFDNLLTLNAECFGSETYKIAIRRSMALHQAMITATNMGYEPEGKNFGWHDFPDRVDENGTPREWAEAMLGALLNSEVQESMENTEYVVRASQGLRSDCMWELARLSLTAKGR